jgi:long-chain fatty acid transport protein
MRVILARRSAGLIREQRAVFLAIPAAARMLKATFALLFLCAVLVPASASAQTPVPTPPPAFAPDEKDFEGLTSLALGSGARAFGMGGAFLARADDATAASWNPAGLSYLRRPEVSLVGARNAFDRGFADDFPEDRFEGYTPDFMAATYPIEFGFVSGAVQVSYQRVFSFRGDRVIAGRPLFYSKTEGGFDVLSAGTGLRVFRGLRLGAAVNRWFHGYSQDKLRTGGGVPTRERQTTKQEIDYRLRGWNVNLGLIWSPLESLNVGLVGKTRFTGDLRGRRQRTDYFSELNPEQADTTNKGDGDVRLDFPGALGVGASWRPRSALTLSADYTRTFWSEGRIRNFFLLPPTLPTQPVPPEKQTFPDLLYPTLDDTRQFDTEQVRLGAEFVVIGARVKVPIRGGVFTDSQYFADAFGQAPRFIGFSMGTGLIVGPVLFDVAFVREQGTYPDPERTGGRVTSVFRRVFVSLIYRHGG